MAMARIAVKCTTGAIVHMPQRIRPPQLPVWTLLAVLAFAALAVFVYAALHMIRCTDTNEAPVTSPDGKWVATSMTKGCPAGLLSSTNYIVSVTLSAHTGSYSAEIFESDDSAEPPQVQWAGVNKLVLKLAESGMVRTSMHRAADVKIEYVVPKRIVDKFGDTERDQRRKDDESKALFKNGKMSAKDLQISLQISQADADEQDQFRKWISENASVEEDSPSK